MLPSLFTDRTRYEPHLLRSGQHAMCAGNRIMWKGLRLYAAVQQGVLCVLCWLGIRGRAAAASRLYGGGAGPCPAAWRRGPLDILMRWRTTCTRACARTHAGTHAGVQPQTSRTQTHTCTASGVTHASRAELVSDIQCSWHSKSMGCCLLLLLVSCEHCVQRLAKPDNPWTWQRNTSPRCSAASRSLSCPWCSSLAR
jgi:hypothetical protein